MAASVPNSAALLVVQTTVPSVEQAAHLARALVGERLAACAQWEPMASVYRWNGALQQESEWRLQLKTTEARWPDLCQRLRDLHPYSQPQVLALPVHGADPGYAAWVAQEVSPA